MRRVILLGASGSIGKQTLSLLEAYPHHYRLIGLSVHRQVEMILPWAEKLRPEWLCITDEPTYRAWQGRNGYSFRIIPPQALSETLSSTSADIVLNAISGAAGFLASYATLQNPRLYLALANKESLVFGGKWLAPYRDRIIPVDSEHSAIFQCLQGEKINWIERIILTASGGPFRGKKREELHSITPAEALRHPVWRMGSRITIDSATLMNKALELIEAYWLFDTPEEKITVWVHPECIVHSLVLFRDGSMKAQLSPPDMRFPILYALEYPERIPYAGLRWDITMLGKLHFEPVDEETFPSLRFARRALHQSTAAPAILNAADEIAVEAFLQGSIGFLHIFDLLEYALEAPEAYANPATLEELIALESDFRQRMRKQVLKKLTHAGGK